jgi:tetratricopeptide (TPR) repeat protein
MHTVDADATRLAGSDSDATVPAWTGTDPDVTRLAGGGSGGIRPAFQPGSAVPPRRDAARIRRGPVPDSAAAGPLEVGQAFGERYHVIRMLGMGGMGAVYQVWDAELEVALALKVVRPDATSDPVMAAEIERRFKRELLLARKVTHPNVVRIHDLGETDGIKYITMPYIEGTDLAHTLGQRQTLPVREALHFARQVATGLAAAHEAGVVHRDLKPANIMIDAEKRALIMDFGIAGGATAHDTGAAAAGGAHQSVHAGATNLGTVIGTLEYMAPEQGRGERVDHRADIYTFGLILYRMLVGTRLAPGATDALSDLTARMTAEPVPLRKIDGTIPPAVESIVSRCLQPDPAARYQTTGALVTALNALDDEGVPLPPPPHLLSSWRFRVAAVVVVAGVVAATWFTGQFVRGSGAPVQRDPIAVLVGDVSNRTGEQVFDGLLEQSLTVGVENAAFISAYQRPAALRVARLLDPGAPTVTLDESTSRLVAMREGIKIVLLGAIEKRGTGYALSVRGIDPTSGKELAASRADARDRNGVLRAGDVLAANLRSALGDRRPADPKETLSSASLDAAAAYIHAQQLSAAGRDQEAIASFKEATERDPGFGRAYGGWAMSATRLGRQKDADPQWKKALAAKDRMTDRERYRLEGAYFTLVTRNFDKALDTYAALVKDYPADGAGHNNLAVGYFRRLEFAKAMEEGQRVLAIYPGSPLYRTNHALYAMYAGDFARAASEAQKLVTDGQAAYDTYLPLAISSIDGGQLEAARAAYDRMAGVDASGASLAGAGLADLALFEGRAADAARLLRAGIVRDQQEQNAAGAAAKQIALADAMGMQGNLRGAVAAARAALAIDKTEAQIVPAVQWLIAAGRLADAAALVADLDKSLEPQPQAYLRMVTGQLALARGKRAEGVAALREAQKLADLWLVRFHLGLAYLDAGYYAEALSEFALCVKRRGEGYAGFLDDIPTARYVSPLSYWTGRAHEGLGLAAEARADYQRFLERQAPDSTDPLAKDARARLRAR